MSGNKKSKTAEKSDEKPTRHNDKKPGPGRPAGSPNRDYAVGQCIGTRCPRKNCCHTNLVVRQRLRTTKYNGIAPDGKPYNRIYRYSCFCGSCNQWCIILEHHLIPEPTEESGYEDTVVDDSEGCDPTPSDALTHGSDPEISVDASIDVLDSILAEENGT